jgi:hypothetical protein
MTVLLRQARVEACRGTVTTLSGLKYTIVAVTCVFSWPHGPVRRRSGIRV